MARTKAELTINGKTVDMDNQEAAEELIRTELWGEPEEYQQPVRVRGKLIKAVLNQSTRKPKDDWPETEQDSIGIGKESFAATDGFMAVVIGEPEETYIPTKRKSALLEAERETIYGECADFQRIEQFIDPKTGELTPYPKIARVVQDHLSQMEEIGVFAVDRLLRMLKVAAAANSSIVHLYRPRADAPFDSLGIKFSVMPDEDQFSLFEDGVEPIPSVAIVMGRKEKKDGE